MNKTMKTARPLFLVFAGLVGAFATARTGVQPLDAEFGGPDRHLAHVGTDKPLYKPGETVYGRAAVLHAFTRKPAQDGTTIAFEVRSPRGDVLTEGMSQVNAGVAAFSWTVPQGQTGGEHKLIANFPHTGDPGAEAAFVIRSYRVPRLKSEIEFLRKAYGPGDEATATLSVKRAEGGIPAGAKITAIAQAGGREIHRATLTLSDAGTLSVSFRLPASLDSSDGNLNFIIEDGGVQESAVKTIPIVLNKVALSFYPEGGDLVGGLKTRLYFEARNDKDMPADVAGRIVDSEGAVAGRFRTEHEGRGRVEFEPQAGRVYHAVLEEPAGVKDHFPLPKVASEGVVLSSIDDIVQPGAALRVKTASSAAGQIAIVVSRYEKEVARKKLDVDARSAREISIDLPDDADGVLRVTALDWEGKPKAERLLLRLPKRHVQIQLKPDPERSSPGSKIAIKVLTTDQTGEPIPATVALNVVDDALLETIEKRERAPRLPVQVLLGSDVRELFDAHVYLSPGEESGRRTDLLLGTQGWRRFVYLDPKAFLSAHGDRAKRALAKREPPPPPAPMAPGGAFLMEAEGAVDMAVAEAAPMPRNVVKPMPAQKEEANLLDVEMEKAPPPPPAAQPAPVLAPARDDAEEKMVAGRARRAAEADEFMPRPQMAAFVRQYAHTARPSRPGEPRRDFAETLYWNAALVTDEKGQGTFEFDLSDSITTYRVRADGFTKDGGLGESDATIESVKPFYAEAKLPLEVTEGDTPEIPIALVSGVQTELTASIDTEISTGIKAAGTLDSVKLSANERSKVYLPLSVEPFTGDVSVRVRASADPYADDVSRVIPVVPAGFPIELSFGGRLEKAVEHSVEIPEGVQVASIETKAAIHPTPLAALTQALAALLNEPCGCFEQTSSSNYPNVMIMQYLQSHRVDDAKLVSRTNDLLDSGYKRLVGYECKQKGYEWFGGDPGHEALTAYGVMEFVDMSKVYSVDQGMLERTRAWLMSRRDGKGGFQRNPQQIDTFGAAPQDITDAYITWALTEAGEKGLEKELAHVRELAGTSDDPYLLALAANVLLNAGDKDGASTSMKKLTRSQQKDGCVRGAKTSITSSGGESLEIETTSLAVLAWLRSPEHTANVESAMKWLLEQIKGGRFGATQATILALKAVTAYDVARATPQKDGTALLHVDGKLVEEVPFTKERQDAIQLPSFAKLLTPGKHTIKLEMVEGSAMPYSLLVRYFAKKPASSDACNVGIQTKLARTEAAEGETVDLSIAVTNRTKDGLPMTVAIVGLPGGLETRLDQLKELARAGTVDAWETRGREVIFYWRGLAPSTVKNVTLSLVAAIPGSYTGPASRAYLYYTDEHKEWTDGLVMKITR